MFSAALNSLSATNSAVVVSQLTAWESGSCSKWRRVAANIKSEVALSTSAFAALLTDFATELTKDPANPDSSWDSACQKHHFKGSLMPPPLPDRLGRAAPIGGYAKIISASPSVSLTPDECEALLRKIILAGSAPNAREARILQHARLGRYVIWAAFSATHPHENPFDRFPKTTDAVRTALGLGECSETETLVLVCYLSGGSSGPIDLFRPTVGEAGSYCWYCPNPNLTASHGLTEPLPPNKVGLLPMPEVVHREISGETLTFPLYLAV